MSSVPYSFEAVKWTRKYINDLPNSAFAFIEPDLCPRATDPQHDRVACGKSHDLNKRHLPHHDKSGKLDLPHLKNAMARVTHADIKQSWVKKAHDHILSHYKQLGMEHPPCQVPGCKGYTPSAKGFFEDYEAFNAARRELTRMRGLNRFYPDLI